jgi:hypothetical protein
MLPTLQGLRIIFQFIVRQQANAAVQRNAPFTHVLCGLPQAPDDDLNKFV